MDLPDTTSLVESDHDTQDGLDALALLPTPSQEPERVTAGTTVDDPKSKKRKDQTSLAREQGKSLLPFSRVQKIIKADRDIPIVAKEATFLICLATEEFIKRLIESSQKVAEREKRATVQHRDIVTVVRKVDEFAFLEELMPWLSAEYETTTKSKPRTASDKRPEIREGQATLHQFVVGASSGQDNKARVIETEDGTMFADET